MPGGLRRIGQDLMSRRHIDAYAVALVAFIFAVLSLIGEVLPEELRWGVLFAGVGLLVFRIALPETPAGVADDLLHDRSAFDGEPLSNRLKGAREVWVFAPSAVNVLSARHCELLRDGPLSNSQGVVRVVVLNPAEKAAVQFATLQLDDSLDYPIQNFRGCLDETLQRLQTMVTWPIRGSVQYRLLSYNPGFSLVAIDPSTRNGVLIVEFHGFHNETTSSRMHLELTRQQSERWFGYWTEQFDRIWQMAVPPRAIVANNID